MKNAKLFNAAMALVEASKFVSLVDPDFADKLLHQAETYKNEIVIDKKLEGEVIDFKERIKKGL